MSPPHCIVLVLKTTCSAFQSVWQGIHGQGDDIDELWTMSRSGTLEPRPRTAVYTRTSPTVSLTNSYTSPPSHHPRNVERLDESESSPSDDDHNDDCRLFPAPLTSCDPQSSPRDASTDRSHHDELTRPQTEDPPSSERGQVTMSKCEGTPSARSATARYIGTE